MEKEQKMQAVARCIEMIPEHGSIRISHVCGNTELNIPWTERIPANYRSISGLLLDSTYNKYIREPVISKDGEIIDYEILSNHNYELEKSIKETNTSIKTMNETVLPENFIIQRNLTIAAIIVAAASAIISLFALFNSSSKKQEQIAPLLQKTLRLLDSMQKFQKGIDSSLWIAVKDSFYQKK